MTNNYNSKAKPYTEQKTNPECVCEKETFFIQNHKIIEYSTLHSNY